MGHSNGLYEVGNVKRFCEVGKYQQTQRGWDIPIDFTRLGNTNRLYEVGNIKRFYEVGNLKRFYEVGNIKDSAK